MRLPAESALETIAAAAEAGITVFDTARAYEDNEELLARALRSCGAAASARIVTKGGMSRPGGAWVADGRAKAIRADCEASLAALDGLPIDLYLLHAPDPRTPWRTSVRALRGSWTKASSASRGRERQPHSARRGARARARRGRAGRDLAFDDRALRGGVVERCEELGIALLAHSPLGRAEARRTRRRRGDARVAPGPLAGDRPDPGARRPETARSARGRRRGTDAGAARRRRAGPPQRRAEVVLVMGVPGAGKSRVAAEYATRGYPRLNRDERAGRCASLPPRSTSSWQRVGGAWCSTTPTSRARHGTR